jgi:hypothetical protein
MFFFSEGFTFRNFLADAFAVFIFVLWFWLLVIVIGDLFRRHDISGWGKAIWVIALIVLPYLAIFAYLITQSTGMAERSVEQAKQAREELRQVVGYKHCRRDREARPAQKIGSDHGSRICKTTCQAGSVIHDVPARRAAPYGKIPPTRRHAN